MQKVVPEGRRKIGVMDKWKELVVIGACSDVPANDSKHWRLTTRQAALTTG